MSPRPVGPKSRHRLNPPEVMMSKPMKIRTVAASALSAVLALSIVAPAFAQPNYPPPPPGGYPYAPPGGGGG